jgi:hypothetical protein
MIGDKSPKSKPLKLRSAEPDDPIYTRGFVIGGVGRNRLPEDEAAAGKRQFLRELAETIGEEMMEQFRGKK